MLYFGCDSVSDTNSRLRSRWAVVGWNEAFVGAFSFGEHSEVEQVARSVALPLLESQLARALG